MNMEDLRKKIDEIDSNIAELISQRIKVAEQIGRGKKKENLVIEDMEREAAVLKNVKNIARRNNVSQEEIEKIYRQIITASKSVQQVDIAFQGEIGAHSEEAASGFFGPLIRSRPCETLEEVFKAVENEEVQFGVVPIENSLEGSISRVYDLMLESSLMVCGETHHRVIHCLIGTREAGLDTIRRVYSHPQALGQCHSFLRHLNCELIPTYDTAGSVKMIKEKGGAENAAIASARAAEIYGMKIIARGIEDNPNNFTRFFVLSREDSPPTGQDKTSIVFSSKDRPGALLHSLNEFASRKINLTKLESRPTRQRPWEYNFYLDFEGHHEDQAAKEALSNLDAISIFMKVLGSYPKAK